MEEVTERVASLEAGHNSLHKDVQNLADAVGSLTRDFRDRMDVIQKQMTEHNRTPWITYASWATVFLIVVGFVGSFYVRDLGKLEKHTEKQGMALLEHIEKGHQKEIQTLERLHQVEIRLTRVEMSFQGISHGKSQY